MSPRDEVPAAWRGLLQDAVNDDAFAGLLQWVEEERARGDVFPPRGRVFAALERTPPDAVRVVILGQDPYPTPGHANGLAFSVEKGVALPGSLRNVYKVLQRDHGIAPAAHGDLGAWADRGVLLLNTVLTVRSGEAASHQGRGWEAFTRAVISAVNRHAPPCVFLLLGKHAEAHAPSVDAARHAVVVAPHPSPLNTKRFLASSPFVDVDRALARLGRPAMDWTV